MGKKVLLVDGGGRGHAIGWKLIQSPRLGKLYVDPGNAGTSQLGENIAVKSTDIDGLLAFALKEKIDLTVVGRDYPLAMGIVDVFQKHELSIFGPTRRAARIETSKIFSKRLMGSCDVPSAPYVPLDDYRQAYRFVRKHFGATSKPIVLKADGLALGKGVYIPRTLAAAEQAVDEIMVKRFYGDAGNHMIAEDFVDGQEVSIHAFCDGKSFKLFPSAQDHKAIFDGDEGPNTGGMGVIAPVPWFNDEAVVSDVIVGPILSGLNKEGRSFVGCLYPGLKISDKGPMVLEFNARFGDPETQVYMRLLKSDLLEILEACVEGHLHEVDIEWNPGFAVCVILASEGDPSSDYKKGVRIKGIFKAEDLPGVKEFHAGTKFDDGGRFVTAGGRVLGVTAVGTTLQGALDQAYNAVTCVHFDGMQYRTDIGAKSLAVR